MLKAYYFPSAGRIGYENPYSQHFKDALEGHYDVLYDRRRPTVLVTLSLLWYAFRADIFFLNWLENVGVMHVPHLQYILARVALAIIKIRGKKMVWILHNHMPHEGANWMTRSMRKTLIRVADVIVSHSQEAADVLRSEAGAKSVYLCHPVAPVSLTENATLDNVPAADIFIWGKILPYKGIAEFLSWKYVQDGDCTVQVLGQCPDAKLASMIGAIGSSQRICYENRKASFDEIAARCRSSRWVVFPYVGECVSSSGALIDTIVMGGNPVGPDRGAFRDLAALGLCRTYRNDEEFAEILSSDWRISDEKRAAFMRKNSWDAFLDQVTERLNTTV